MLRAFFLLGLLLSRPAPPIGGAPYVHEQSGYRFPSSLGEFHRRVIHKYAGKKLGVSIRYEIPDMPDLGGANIYVYDLGFSGIRDGSDSDLVGTAFLQAEMEIEAAMKEGDYSDVTMTSAPAATMQVRAGTPRFRMAKYRLTLVEIKQRAASWLLVTGGRRHFLKIRYTCNENRAGEGERALDHLLIAFFAANPESS